MAASSKGSREESAAKCAFQTSLKGQKDRRTWLDPPVVGVMPYATAGLEGLYTQVTRQEPVLDNDTNDFTDENGVFCPKANMPLLARRYRFMETIGSGVSSITICAQDTFRPDQDKVAIKVLNVNYYRLGYQESSSIRRLNKADPDDFSGTLRLLNIFSFSGHFCMVFELLHPKPLHHYFKKMDNNQEKLRWIRKVTIRLLQVLGFLQQENVIHADLKPENVLCRSDNLSSGIKVIDFGNAIHCVYDELSLYYDDFELQTLLYRAPEVLFGLPFGLEIDMWSLGCILAELYMGKPLFFALTKENLLERMVSVLGPLPTNVLQRGKFYQEYSSYTGSCKHRWLLGPSFTQN
ncbi:uncharacterized protein [Amphiura filiformis]|uniref:uncharacterized protein n=1 Tax=Amphiura filiformis TaxID=82378 RepID=UPI003B21AD20